MHTSYQEIIISSIGEFGYAQILIIAACTMPKFIAAWSMLMMSFAGAQPDWWKVTSFSNNTNNVSTQERLFKVCPTNANESIVFDKEIYTIISEWELVCERKWIPIVITTLQMVGVLLGAGVIGQLGDLIGRRKCLIGIYFMELLCIFVQGFVGNWYMMAITAFLVGFSLGGFLVIVNIYMLEFIDTKWRTFAAILPMWGLGVTFFGIAFKILPNWRHLCISTGILGIPVLILMWFMPPSARWLFTHGRIDEGKQVLRNLAKRNGLPVPDLSSVDVIAKKGENKTVKYTYLSLFTEPSTRVISTILSYIWFTLSFGYYGLTLGVSRLSGDITVNMVIMGLGETVCMAIVCLVSKCFGRKYTSMMLLFFTSLPSFGITVAYFVTTTKFELATNILALTSRFFLSAAWASIIVFTAELYPTVIRATGYGWVSVVARVGGILAPQNKTLHDISTYLPFTLTGALTGLSCFACWFLRDTYSAPLDDHLNESASSSENCEETKEIHKENGYEALKNDGKITSPV